MNDSMKDKKLIGLKYTPGEGLPKIIVKTSGRIAENVLKSSTVSGPRVIKDRELVEKLYRLPVDAEISPDTFFMVAIILTHVFSIEEKLRMNHE